MLWSVAANAQDVIVRGRFQADSLRIGETVPFSLSASYPSELQLLFPDSTFNFTPFELGSKKYFPTKTTNQISYDSVVYYLLSYEVDSAQFLQLPVFVVHPGDCTSVVSNRDSIFLKHLVEVVPDSVSAQQLPLKTNTKYLAVDWLFNYPIVIIGLAAVVTVLTVTWLIFGRRIRRYFRLKRLNKNHYTFLERYSNALQGLQPGTPASRAEKALVIWKQYMESLENKPYTKYTSKEILRMETNDKLAFALKGIDRMIYGGIGSEPQQAFAELRDYSQSHFMRKLEEVKHG